MYEQSDTRIRERGPRARYSEKKNVLVYAYIVLLKKKKNNNNNTNTEDVRSYHETRIRARTRKHTLVNRTSKRVIKSVVEYIIHVYMYTCAQQQHTCVRVMRSTAKNAHARTHGPRTERTSAFVVVVVVVVRVTRVLLDVTLSAERPRAQIKASFTRVRGAYARVVLS